MGLKSGEKGTKRVNWKAEKKIAFRNGIWNIIFPAILKLPQPLSSVSPLGDLITKRLVFG